MFARSLPLALRRAGPSLALVRPTAVAAAVAVARPAAAASARRVTSSAASSPSGAPTDPASPLPSAPLSSLLTWSSAPERGQAVDEGETDPCKLHVSNLPADQAQKDAIFAHLAPFAPALPKTKRSSKFAVVGFTTAALASSAKAHLEQAVEGQGVSVGFARPAKPRAGAGGLGEGRKREQREQREQTPTASLRFRNLQPSDLRAHVLALCDKFAPRAARTARHARNDSRTTVAFTSAADAAAALAAVRSFCARTGEEVDGRFVGDAVKKSAKKEPADDGRQGEQ